MAILLHASRSLPGGDRLRRSPGLVFQAFDEAVHDVPQFCLPLQAVAIFQSFNLLPRTSALRNVEVPLLYGDGHQRQARARQALERVGLGHRLRHRSTELSGGEQQRVSIARALVTQPRILLADEPTGNLDSRTSADIMGILQELNSQQKMTVVVVTHELDVAAYCQRIISVFDGEIAKDAPVTERKHALSGPKEGNP